MIPFVLPSLPLSFLLLTLHRFIGSVYLLIHVYMFTTWCVSPWASQVKWKSLTCPTLCDPMEYTVHGILQARILEWVAFPFSRGSSQSRDRSQVSCIASGFFTSWATREAQEYWSGYPIPSPVVLPDLGIELGSPALQVNSLPTEISGKPYVYHI